MITKSGSHDTHATETADGWAWTCTCGGHSTETFRDEYQALNDCAVDGNHRDHGTVGGITSTGSRTIHVIPDASPADRGATFAAACGQSVTARWYEVKPQNEVCLKCRKAMGWPMVVTWTSQGHTFTTDFHPGTP